MKFCFALSFLCGVAVIALIYLIANQHILKNITYVLGNGMPTSTMSNETVSHDRKNATDCTVDFAPAHSLPSVALLSPPGSGNTWLRHLLELVTGVYTGSVFRDKGLIAAGFRGEAEQADSGRTIVVKTHVALPEMIRSYHAVILLLRNPYGSLAAEYNRKQGGQTFYKRWKDDDVEREGFLRAIRMELRRWSSIAINALRCEECRLLVVHYEDLVERTNEQLQNILKFLNFSVERGRFHCIEKDKEGHHHRSVPEDDRKRQYHMLRTLDEEFDIDGKIKSVSDLLVARGYSPIRQYVV